MQPPFYYSFKKFEENYKKDLENWLKIYPDADELDFIAECKEHYGWFILPVGYPF